jgi:hypothetical protein
VAFKDAYVKLICHSCIIADIPNVVFTADRILQPLNSKTYIFYERGVHVLHYSCTVCRRHFAHYLDENRVSIPALGCTYMRFR